MALGLPVLIPSQSGMARLSCGDVKRLAGDDLQLLHSASAGDSSVKCMEECKSL